MAVPQHPLITEWYEAEWRREAVRKPPDTRLVMGFPLWGKSYVRRFLDFMLPSLRANRGAFLEARTDLVVYVDEPSRQMLPPSLHMRVIPHDVMRLVHAEPGYKYTLLAAVHSLLIGRAAFSGAGFSMAVGDIVYSEHFLERLFTLGQTHDAIATLSMIANQTALAPDLEAFRRGNTLAIPAAELGALGWKHLCGSMKSWVLDGTDYPDTHFTIARERDAVILQCGHPSPIWLSNARCKTAPLELNDTLDGNSRAYMGANYYVPQPADDMVFISLDDTRESSAGRIDAETFGKNLALYGPAVQVIVPTSDADQ